MKRFLAACVLWVSSLAAALAQTTIAGVPYFPQILPAQTVVGRLTAGAGPTEAIPFQTLANAVSALQPAVSAASLVGNTSASSAVPTGFTLQSLTLLNPPHANNDYLVIYDSATGTLKRTTPGLIAAAATSGVSSLNGATGAVNLANTAPWNATQSPYGAICDGATDDFTALQALIDAAVDQVSIPSGTCLTSNTLTVTTKKIIQGAGPQSIIKLAGTNTGTARPVIKFNSGSQGSLLRNLKINHDGGVNLTVDGGQAVYINTTDITVDRIEVDGNRSSQVAVNHGVDCGQNNTTVRNSYVHDINGYAIICNRANNVRVDSNRIERFKSTHVAITANSAGSGTRYNNIYITDNIIDGSDHATSGTAQAIFVYGDASLLVSNVQVKGNYYKGTQSTTSSTPAGFVCFYCLDVNVSNNTVIYSGIALSFGDCDEVTVTGNVLRGFTYYGIELVATSRVAASGNTIDGENLGVYGFAIQGAAGDNIAVSGNMLYRLATWGIFAHWTSGTSKALTISGNSIHLANGATGCMTLESGHEYASVTGNLCTSTGSYTYGIATSSIVNGVIAGNHIRAATNGIALTSNSTSDVAITGNTFTSVVTKFTYGGSFGTNVRYTGNGDRSDWLDVANNIRFQIGTGTPESNVTAGVGSVFMRIDNANSLYVKQTGTGSTGWVLK